MGERDMDLRCDIENLREVERIPAKDGNLAHDGYETLDRAQGSRQRRGVGGDTDDDRYGGLMAYPGRSKSYRPMGR